MSIYRTPAFEVRLSESATGTIQLFRVGTFHHPNYGTFEITPQILSEIKKNFDAKVRGIDIAIDYKHDNEDAAAGWIKELKLSDDGNALYAIVDWTPDGQKALSDKEFRYISPEFTFAYQDNETLKQFGPTLLGAGLTNRPVIKKMDPVVELSEYKSADQSALKEALKKKSESNSIVTDSKLKKPIGEKKMDANKKLADMSPEELVAKIQELMDQLAQLKGQNDMMAADAQKVCAAQELAEKKVAFAKLMSEGKACAAQEESWIKNDMVKFVELSQPMKLSEQGNAGKDKEDSSGSVDDRIHKLAEKLMTDKSAKDLSQAYKMVLSANPELSKEKYGI